MKTLIKKIVPKQLIDLGLEAVTFYSLKKYKRKYPNLTIRRGETDKNVFRSIFISGEFKLPIDIDPKLIIDAGAYTGLSALYYSSTYPSAKIIAIEPESSNFDTLEKNTMHLPNVSRIKAGLWDKNAFLKITDRGTGKWGFKVEEVSESDDFDIKSVTIDKVLSESGFDRIDILKLDIEGSEKQLFSSDDRAWLDKVNVMVIELHDRIHEGCTESLYAAIDLNEWKEYKEGEKVILISNDYYKAYAG